MSLYATMTEARLAQALFLLLVALEKAPVVVLDPKLARALQNAHDLLQSIGDRTPPPPTPMRPAA